jgi:hypothetical protein
MLDIRSSSSSTCRPLLSNTTGSIFGCCMSVVGLSAERVAGRRSHIDTERRAGLATTR